MVIHQNQRNMKKINIINSALIVILMCMSATVQAQDQPTLAPCFFDLTYEAGLASFTIVDANNDGKTWMWDSQLKCVLCPGLDDDSDDWLITPAVLLEAGKTYQMVVNCASLDKQNELIELAYGVFPTADAMKNKILEPFVLNFKSQNEIGSYDITVQETGDYYLGVHCFSDGYSTNDHAAIVYNISVIDNYNITADENPDELGVYYSTYYDRNIAHALSDGATAYTATFSDGDLLLTPIEDGIIPKGEAVIIRSNSSNITLALSDSEKKKSYENVLSGDDIDTVSREHTYILSYGQNGLGFYRIPPEERLAAHKAFLVNHIPAEPMGLRMAFVDRSSSSHK